LFAWLVSRNSSLFFDSVKVLEKKKKKLRRGIEGTGLWLTSVAQSTTPVQIPVGQAGAQVWTISVQCQDLPQQVTLTTCGLGLALLYHSAPVIEKGNSCCRSCQGFI
jgi:hypothetical protein